MRCLPQEEMCTSKAPLCKGSWHAYSVTEGLPLHDMGLCVTILRNSSQNKNLLGGQIMKIIDLNEAQLEYVENQLSAFDEKYIT